MKIFLLLVFLIHTEYMYSQEYQQSPVELLPNSCHDIVYSESSWDSSINSYYLSITKIACNYLYSFHNITQSPKIYLKFSGDEYFVSCDNINHNYYTVLISNEIRENSTLIPGLYIILPDRCQSIENLIKLIDAGMFYYEEMEKCIVIKSQDPTYHGYNPCVLDNELINELLTQSVSKRKHRFVEKMTIKYKHDLQRCVYINSK